MPNGAAIASLLLMETERLKREEKKSKKKRIAEKFSDIAKSLVGKDIIIYTHPEIGVKNVVVIDKGVPNIIKKIIPIHLAFEEMSGMRLYDIYKYDEKKLRPIIEKLKKKGVKIVHFKPTEKEFDKAFEKLKEAGLFAKLGEII